MKHNRGLQVIPPKGTPRLEKRRWSTVSEASQKVPAIVVECVRYYGLALHVRNAAHDSSKLSDQPASCLHRSLPEKAHRRPPCYAVRGCHLVELHACDDEGFIISILRM
ncbi:unnamed protein product [Cuscuta europaea]|uniref:Uncharacterized protein n=1 Tax=Cuscuta europaea TaxID=41803 RepID=A0A9P1E5X7_CUSEU|nr:unnamed protein product [Cuscuta europaea]